MALSFIMISIKTPKHACVMLRLADHHSSSITPYQIFTVFGVYLALQGSLHMLFLLPSTFCYLSFLSVFHSGGEGASGESLSSTEIFRGGAAILPGPGRDLNMIIAFTATEVVKSMQLLIFLMFLNNPCV